MLFLFTVNYLDLDSLWGHGHLLHLFLFDQFYRDPVCLFVPHGRWKLSKYYEIFGK